MKKCYSMSLAVLCVILVADVASPKIFVGTTTVASRGYSSDDLVTPRKALFDAAREGDRTLVFKLIEEISYSEGDQFFSQNDLATAYQLLAQHADINARDKNQRTVLHDLAMAGDTRAVEILLSRRPKPDLEAEDEDGCTPLHCAARSRNGRIVTLLLEHGADWKAMDFDDFTPLTFMALYGNESVVNAFAQYPGVDINFANEFGVTPVQVAAMWGLEKSVKALLLAGADPLKKDNEGLHALDYARQGGHVEVVALITQHLERK